MPLLLSAEVIVCRRISREQLRHIVKAYILNKAWKYLRQAPRADKETLVKSVQDTEVRDVNNIEVT